MANFQYRSPPVREEFSQRRVRVSGCTGGEVDSNQRLIHTCHHSLFWLLAWINQELYFVHVDSDSNEGVSTFTCLVSYSPILCLCEFWFVLSSHQDGWGNRWVQTRNHSFCFCYRAKAPVSSILYMYWMQLAWKPCHAVWSLLSSYI